MPLLLRQTGYNITTDALTTPIHVGHIKEWVTTLKRKLKIMETSPKIMTAIISYIRNKVTSKYANQFKVPIK